MLILAISPNTRMRLGKNLSVGMTLTALGLSLGMATSAGYAQTLSNLRGKWIGTLRCRSFNGTRATQPTAVTTMSISQLGRYFAAQIEDANGVRTYNGELIREAGRDGRVEALLIECRSSSHMNNYAEVVNLRGLAVDPDGKLRGESIFRNMRGEIGNCRWHYQRTTTKDPRIAFCR